MKKRIVLLLAAMMVSALISVPVMAEEADLAGTWYALSMEQDGMQMDASVLAAMGMSITMTLNEDGTAVLAMGDQETECTWEGQTLITEANELPMELNDGELTIDQNGAIMIFSKEAPEITEFSMAPAVEDPELSDFNGSWNTVTYVMLGIPMPIKLGASTEINLQIEDGKVAYTEMIYDLNTSSSEPTETIEKEFTATLEDGGILFVDFNEETVLSHILSGSSGIRLTLHEDGKLSGEIPELTETMEMFAAMSQGEENTDAEAADEAGSSGGSSSGEALSAYLVFEKAE